MPRARLSTATASYGSRAATTGGASSTGSTRQPAGIEGIAFDQGGKLWAVSEAGARHVYDNFLAALVMPFFPLVFAIDPARLE
jgi:hypothetical protein